MIRKDNDGVRWRLQTDFEALLEPVLRAPFRVVKESPAKMVAVHTVGGRQYYVKRYRHHQVPFRPLKYFFKASQAAQEWALAQALAEREVPIVRHLALGERWTAFGLKESVLITEGFDGQPLHEARGYDPSRVVQWLAGIHQRGVLQRDLHPANILVSQASGELRLVDLHGTVVRAEVSEADRRGNLAQLASALSLPVGEELQRRARELRRDQLAERSKRCWRHNRDFEPRRFGNLRWQVRRSWLEAHPGAAGWLGNPDGLLEGAEAMFKEGRSSTVGSKNGWVLKRYNVRTPLNAIKAVFRPSKARQAFRKAYHLELAGISTARVLAVANRRCCGLASTGYLVMEEIPGATLLSRWKGPPGLAVEKVAKLLAALHDAGFCHRDLKASNIVFDGQARVYLIDMEGLAFLGEVRPEQAASDLERLDRSAATNPVFTRTERWGFLRRYCRARGIRAIALRPV